MAKHLILLCYCIGAVPLVWLVGINNIHHSPLVIGYGVIAGAFVRAAYRR